MVLSTALALVALLLLVAVLVWTGREEAKIRRGADRGAEIRFRGPSAPRPKDDA